MDLAVCYMESNLLSIQIVLFHLSEHFSYPKHPPVPTKWLPTLPTIVTAHFVIESEDHLFLFSHILYNFVKNVCFVVHRHHHSALFT